MVNSALKNMLAMKKLKKEHSAVESKQQSHRVESIVDIRPVVVELLLKGFRHFASCFYKRIFEPKTKVDDSKAD